MSENSVSSVTTATPVATEVQNKKRSSSVANSTIGLGVVGAGAGYLVGGKRPTLEQILAMEPDTFEKSVKDAKDNVKTEAYKVKAEIDKLNDADSEFVTDKTKKEAFDAEVNKQALADDAAESKALKTANENYDAKLLEELNKDKAEGEKFAKVADAPADAQNAAKEALKESDEARALKTAENNVRVAKEKMVRESTDDSVKNIVNEFDDAVEAAKTKKNEKIASLVQDVQMKASLEKIKKLFPKEGKGKAALMWGGIAAAVGLVAGLVLGGNNKKQV